jgi:hypothetical protein
MSGRLTDFYGIDADFKAKVRSQFSPMISEAIKP